MAFELGMIMLNFILMTTLIIESDSESKIQQVLHLAQELGLSVKTAQQEQRVLTDADMILGIGRPATDAELTEYILKAEDEEGIDIDEVFKRYEE